MLNATITKKIDVHQSLIKLSVRLDADINTGLYLPGQYTTIGLPKPDDETGKKFIKRAYSLCSSPDNAGELEFFISLVENGELTPRIFSLKAGDRVLCGPKIVGTFTLKEIPQKSHLVLVATGTGLAPYISMIRTQSTWDNFSDIVLVNGVRYEHDLAYSDEIEELQRQRSGLQYFPIVTRPQGEWSGHKGRIQKLFVEKTVEVHPERSHLFLCGNPAMIEETQALFETLGFREHTKKQSGNIHIEKYW